MYVFSSTLAGRKKHSGPAKVDEKTYNLGRSKEAFWQRDYDAMADELARGADVVQHAGATPSAGSDSSELSTQSNESLSRRGSSAEASSNEVGMNKAASDDLHESNAG